MTRDRGGSRRVRLTISCPDLDWERIREVAEHRGVSINEHVIGAGLSVDPGDDGPDDGPAALDAREQRELFDRVARLADGMVGAADEGLVPGLHRAMRLVVMAVLHDMVRRGPGAGSGAAGGVRDGRGCRNRAGVPGVAQARTRPVAEGPTLQMTPGHRAGRSAGAAGLAVRLIGPGHARRLHATNA